MALAGGIGTALYHRERTGEGIVVDVSLMSVGLWAMGMTISGTSVLDADTLPHQYHRNSTNPLVNEYRTKDGGFIALAFLQSDRYWPEFCVLVDRFDWLADERFTDSAARAAQHRARSSTCSTSCSSSGPRRVAGAARPSRTASGTRSCPPARCSTTTQALANGYVQRVEHDGDGKIVLVAAPGPVRR